MTDYWGHLKYSPNFIQAALYVGTPKCLKLADLAIKEYPQSIDLFQLCYIIPSKLILRDIEQLLQKKRSITYYLIYHSLKYDEISHLARECERNNLQLWARNHLYELLSDKDKKFYFPTDDDLVAELKTESKKEHVLDYIEVVWIREI